MAAEIKIHRGDQIGGCITEIWTEKTRILIDFGEELPGSKNLERFELDWEASDDGAVKKPAVSAVFFTHYHGDHVGRFMEAYAHAALYMSELSRNVLLNIHGYLAKNLPWLAKRREQEGNGAEAARISEEVGKHEEALKILESQGEKGIHTFCPHEKKTITELGDIQVTPFWVDHSAGDACMFLIETEDKRILHTGDFRGHGLHGEEGDLMCAEIRRLAEEKQINVLITEGTMMSRQDEKPYSERELLNTAKQFFQEQDHRHAFLIISSTNLDSISAFYQAAKDNGIRMYCHNPYVKKQLETLGKYAHAHWNLPDMSDVERVDLRDAGQQKAMRENGFVTIIKANELGEVLVQSFQDCNPVIIYSMWQGYVWRKLDSELCGFLERCHDKGIPIIPPNTLDPKASPEPRMHTSGHASPELIAEVIRAADPEALYPIHTEDVWEFLRLDIPKLLKEDLQERMLQAGEADGYSPDEDHRYLNAPALEKFLPEGTHHAFVELVKKYPRKLALCFRGNSDDAAIIYYKNHAVFHITKSGYVRFNFDHARYMDDWRAQRDWLERKGFSFENKKEPKPKKRRNKNGTASVTYSIGEISISRQAAMSLSFDQLEELCFRLCDIIDSFFDAKKNGAIDQFRKSITGEEQKTDRELTEKAVQQQLFISPGCKKLADGYCFYDMEFSQPYGKLFGCKNQPDMMAIRFDANGKPKRLALVEVKSTPEALGGASGLEPHVQGMEEYPTVLLPARRRDACGILNQYIALGLIRERSMPFKVEDFERLPIEILLIFTGKDAPGKDTLRELDDGGYQAFLEKMGYQVTDDAIPQPLGIKKMKVYRKEL